MKQPSFVVMREVLIYNFKSQYIFTAGYLFYVCRCIHI
jgi:hypothetical protein